jgi:hypothetical protein
MNIQSWQSRVFSTVLLYSAAWLVVAVNVEAASGQGYGQYFSQNFNKYGGQLGTQSNSRYLYDKYFYHRPTVSPYLNVFRPDTMSGTSYQAYVRPEQQRREAMTMAQSSYIAERKIQGNVGDTRFPGAVSGLGGGTIYKTPQRSATPSAYYNHWYGSWAR